MAHLIDKSAVVAEIEKEIKRIYAGREYVGIPSNEENVVMGLQKAEDIINTLEVKEIDLEEEPVNKDLEKAAMQYAKLKHTDAALQKIVSWDFKAGAQWQKEKDDGLLAAVYMDGVEKGKKAMREQMFEKVCKFLGNDLCCYIRAQDFAIEHQRLENDLKQAMKDG